MPAVVVVLPATVVVVLPATVVVVLPATVVVVLPATVVVVVASTSFTKCGMCDAASGCGFVSGQTETSCVAP